MSPMNKKILHLPNLEIAKDQILKMNYKQQKKEGFIILPQVRWINTGKINNLKML